MLPGMAFTSADTVRGTAYAVPAVRTYTGREYLRVSQDKGKRQRSVTEQHDDNGRRAARHGIAITGGAYVDNDRSASRYATKKRGDFARLVADLESGAFGAEVLVLWENSRYSRRTIEWLSMMETCERQGVLIFITSDNRLYDLSNWKDRRHLREDASDSETETDKTSMRIQRTMADQASKGRPHGRAPYGLRPVYNDRRELVTWEEDTAEAAPGEVSRADAVREVFMRLAAGHSQRSITRDFEARGIRTKKGAPWVERDLRDLAGRVAYIGKRTHRGEVIEGTWDGLADEAKGFTEETFNKVQRMFKRPEHRATRDGRAVHVLSRIIRCDVCGGEMRASERRGSASYVCNDKSCTLIGKAGVDEFLVGTAERPGVILAYLASPKVYERFAATPEDESRAVALRAEIERLRGDLEEMEAVVPTSAAVALKIGQGMEGLQVQIVRLEDEERALSMPSALTDLITPGADVAQSWAAAPVTARRKVARLLLSPEVLGEVRIQRAGRRGTSAAERVHWHTGDGCMGCTAA